MKELLAKIVVFLKEKRAVVIPCAFVFVCVVCGVLSVLMSGVTTAYSVEYGGEQIALIESEEVFNKGKELALTKVSGENPEGLIYTPVLKKVLTLDKRIVGAETLGNAIINNTDEITKGVALTVNGEEKVFAKTRDDLDKYLAARLKEYDVASADENSSEFIDKVEIKEVYCSTASFAEADKQKSAVSKLNVKTTIKYNEDVVVSYKTVTKYDSSQLFTYRKTTQEGKNGLNHNVDKVVFVNGVEKQREHLEQQVVTAPVNKVVVVGTKYPQDTTASAAGMICPLPRGAFYVSSEYGEIRSNGKPHYALDLATYGKSPPIYAVKGGVVETAKYSSSYGYYVVIDHGAGVKTLYAHASALYVSKGDRVTQGQTIARVGSTGQSSGNHLHIEVKIHGQKKNPRNYINF